MEALLKRGEELGWKAVRLKPGMVLVGGEKNWRAFLSHATTEQQKLLEGALWVGPCQGPGQVGVVG